MNIKKFFLSFFSFIGILTLTTKAVSAHCPLCTIGAGAAAAGAVWLGVNKVVVALFIGAFAMSMGLWFARLIKKKYLPLQKPLIIIIIFVSTVLPLIPLFKVIGPLYIPIGEYGKTFAINYSLISSLIGAALVFIAPSLSKKITTLRHQKIIPFQGILLTFLLLIIIGAIIQVVM